jgi:dTDP-4-dehydrorhamnose 3,5-epimerase
MEVVSLKTLKDVKLIKPKCFVDERGFFLERYRKSVFAQHGISEEFVQDNHSYSQKGTLRGMHFQSGAGQAKLISVIQGRVFDVAVDIRPTSPTFGMWEGVILDGENHHQLYIPVGFAHGFCVISDMAHLAYKVSTYYDPQLEKGFRFDDPAVGINWPKMEYVLSNKDKVAPCLREIVT